MRDYPLLSKSRMVALVRERIPTITPDIAMVLVERVNSDPVRLDREIERFALYAQERPVSRDSILANIPDTADVSIFWLVDAITASSRREAHSTFVRLLTHHPIYQIFASVMSNLRTCLFVSRLSTLGCGSEHIVRLLGITAFQVDKYRKIRDITRIRGFFDRCCEIERDNRTGAGVSGPEGLTLAFEMEILMLG